jgi:hypothetical protein
VFDDELDDEIVTSQTLYNARGARDTKNTADNVGGFGMMPPPGFDGGPPGGFPPGT